MSEQVLIVTGVSPDGVEAILNAIAEAGGGVVGDYSHCSFINDGYGRFKPGESANPHVGEPETINQVKQVRIETFCERPIAKQVVQAIRKAHVYEEPVIYVLPLLNADDL